MKRSGELRKRCGCGRAPRWLAIGIVMVTPGWTMPLQAAVYYWDANGVASGLYGTGDWNTTDLTWRTPGSGDPLTPWVNGNTAYLLGASTLNLTENISMSGSYNQGGSITFNSSSGKTLTLAGTSWYNNSGAQTVTYNVPVTLAANFTPSGSGTAVFNQPITASGAYYYAIQLSADVIFNAANDLGTAGRGYWYLGATSLAQISIGNDGAFGPWNGSTPNGSRTNELWIASGNITAFRAVGGARTVSNGIWLNTGSLTWSFPGTNALTFSGKMVTPTSSTVTLITTNKSDTTFSDVISGSANIVKDGTGNLILSGKNTYSGTTAINAGTLMLNGTNTGGKAFTVAVGATLGGSGTLTAVVTNNGTIAPGFGVGMFTVNGDCNFKENAIYQWEYENGTGDLVTVNGTLTLPLVATVNVAQVTGDLPAIKTIFTATTLAGADDLSEWVVNGLSHYGVRIIGGTHVVVRKISPGTVIQVR